MNPDAAVARLAAVGLAGAETARICLGDADAVLARAAAQRVLPWVAAADATGLIEGVSDEWRQSLRRQRISAALTTLAAHAAAASVVTRLRAIGVTDIRVLKGCATGHVDYDRAVDRYSTDVDLLIRSQDLALALTVFPQEQIPVPRRPGWDVRYGRATTVRLETGVEIDIHRTLAHGYFGLAIPIDELFQYTDTFSIGGTTMVTLDGPGRLIHAALHLATSEHAGLHSTRDVAQLILTSKVDWEEAVRRAQRWRIDGIVARGVQLAWQRLAAPHHPIVDWAGGVRVTGRQAVALRSVGGAHVRQFLTAPLALPLHRWPGYVGPIVLPSRAYLAEHGKSWTQRAGGLLGRVRSAGAGATRV